MHTLVKDDDYFLCNYVLSQHYQVGTWFMFSLPQRRCNIVLLCGQHNIGVGSNSIWVGPNVIYTAIAAICTACMNSNKVSRVKYWEGGPMHNDILSAF